MKIYFTMNKEDLCSSLDNTVLPKEDKSLQNSNTYEPPPEEFSESFSGQIEEDNLLEESHGQQIKEDSRKKALLDQYKKTTLDQKLHNCREDYQEIGDKNPIVDIEKSSNSVKMKQRDSYHGSSSSVPREVPSSVGCINDTILVSECEGKGGHDDSEREDIDEDVMSGSYGEISLDRELFSSNKNSDSQSSKEDLKLYPSDENKSESMNEMFKENKRPDSLVLTQNLLASPNEDALSQIKDTGLVQQMHKSQQTSECRTSAEVSPSLSSEEFALHSVGHARSGSDTSGLSELQGTLTVDGDLVTFVAEDLQEKIKMSSPVSRVTDSSSFPGSRSSTPSLYRQALQPQFHIVDPHVISDLESHAKKVATVVDTMLENLSETLQSFSSLTVGCMETYENSVCKTCDAVDANIKSVYQLMAKCEELSNSMQPLYKISGDVKHIKKMLDQLEHAVEHKS